MAVVTANARSLADRVALRKGMVRLRLAQFREGVWLRPANLLRSPDGLVADQCAFFSSHHAAEPLELARALWDLPGWAAQARRLDRELGTATSLKDGFIATAAVIRHLLIDPCLPAELLPANWPGSSLRDRYAEFRSAYAERLREYSQGSA
jgi:phenylacetic acid degradation operon negative regulatory protein